MKLTICTSIALALLLAQSGADFRRATPRGTRVMRVTEGPSVLVLLLDDVAQADTDEERAEGFMPNLSALAAAGLEFRNGLANPVCSPSRRSLHTGRWWYAESGDVCGAPGPAALPLADVTLGDVALAAGLSTGFFGKWHVGPNVAGANADLPEVHGYQAATWTPMNPSNCGGTDFFSWPRIDDTAPGAPGGGVSSMSSDYAPEVFADALVSWWTGTPGRKLAVWCTPQAHGPMHRPPAHLLPPGYPPTSSSRSKYEAEQASADVLLGNVMAACGIDASNTIIVVWGDNGTPANVSPLRTLPNGTLDVTPAKTTALERGIVVPAVLAGPGISAGLPTQSAHLADILPTIAALLGAPEIPGIDGRDLIGSPRTWSIAGNELGPNSDYCIRMRKQDGTGYWKLRHRGDAPSISGVPRAEQWFDLEADPSEFAPLVTIGKPLVEQWMRATLVARIPQ